MIIKSPSKRISHLNLKFLDLKIMSVEPNNGSYTVPLPAVRTLHRHQHNTSELSMNNSYIKSKLQTTKLHGRLHSFEQNTNDVTSDHYNQNTSILEQNGNTTDVLNYLSVDSDTVCREIDDKLKSKQLSTCVNSKPQTDLHHQVSKYARQIKMIEKQNSLIHDQILKIYSSKLGEKNLQVKITRNMRILADKNSQTLEKTNPLQQHYDEMSQSFRYKSEDKEIDKLKRNFFDKFKTTQEAAISNPTIPRQQKSSTQLPNLSGHQKKQQQPGTTQSQLKKSKKKPHRDIHLPSLVKNKYEYFYEDLYKQKKQKTQENEVEIEKLNELKKKMISNNFDKDFLEHVEKKKLRVPEFLRNLR